MLCITSKSYSRSYHSIHLILFMFTLSFICAMVCNSSSWFVMVMVETNLKPILWIRQCHCYRGSGVTYVRLSASYRFVQTCFGMQRQSKKLVKLSGSLPESHSAMNLRADQSGKWQRSLTGPTNSLAST